MAIKIVKQQNQAQGAFDFGKILENKPIGFPHEGGVSKSISNLFYWAHAWSDEGGLIAEHPHQGFEIMSYIIKGEISHYDNKNDEWKSLCGGDAQLIKAGSGITHAERFLANTDIFQIWFDPNLRNTLAKPASYNDYKDESFPKVQFDGYSIKTIAGDGAPLSLDAEKIDIDEINLDKGFIEIMQNQDKLNLYYLIRGSINVENNDISRDDLFYSENESCINITVSENSVLFRISLAKSLSYQTYAESQGIN